MTSSPQKFSTSVTIPLHSPSPDSPPSPVSTGYSTPPRFGSHRKQSDGLSQSSPYHSSSSNSGFSSTPMSRRQKILTAAQKRSKYLLRLLHFKQMDFQYAFWQLIHLFISPQKVYRNFQYRKQTRDQWARDDPAFLVLLTISLIGTSIGFSQVLGLGFLHTIKFILWVVFMDCIGVGLLIATFMWLLANRLLCTSVLLSQNRRSTTGDSSSIISQDVEWGYAFDVHLNAFFPLLIILHLFQLPLLYHVILSYSYVATFIGNTFWLVAILYYIYITFLGYNSLPHLRRTEVLLYPMTITVMLYVLSLIMRWNFSFALCNFYEMRSLWG